jgi:hypothetical protein
VSRETGENREIADVLGHQTPAVTGGRVQYSLVRAARKFGRSGDGDNIVSPIAEHLGQGWWVHLIKH